MLGDAEAKWEYNRAVHYPYVFPFVTALTWVMIAGCIAAAYLLRRDYVVWLRDNHADNDPFDPTWLLHLVLMAIAGGAYWIAKSAISIWYQFDYFEDFAWDFLALFLNQSIIEIASTLQNVLMAEIYNITRKRNQLFDQDFSR